MKIGASLKSKLFIKIWLWSLLLGLVCGIGLSLLIGAAIGLFKSQASGDDMAQGIIFAFLLFGIGNLSSYVTAVVIGSKYINQQGQNPKLFLAKATPLSTLFFLLSFVLPPLLLFGSVIAALIAVFSIARVMFQPALTSEF